MGGGHIPGALISLSRACPKRTEIAVVRTALMMYTHIRGMARSSQPSNSFILDQSVYAWYDQSSITDELVVTTTNDDDDQIISSPRGWGAGHA